MKTQDFAGLSLTMMMRRAAGQKVISQTTATKISEMILIAECGESIAAAQQPLTVKADGDYWLVQGLKTEALLSLMRESSEKVGVLNLRICQYDGQIVDLDYRYSD